ncbi:MAG: tetratricopeptide repeat protein [Planctomycetota bacterium]
MAKKKKAKKASDPKARRPAKSQGFAPSASGSVEGHLQKCTSGRGKPRNPLAIAQEIADLAWNAPHPQGQAELARQALNVSPDCADAYAILANQATSRDQARQLLEEGMAAGQRAIGSKAFETSTGLFWLDQRTRPYMRARLGLAQCLWESGQRVQAVEHYAEMLRLNPNDNQGVRYLLLGALVDLDRDDDAQRLIQRYDQEGSADWNYTTALLAFRREGDSAISRSLLWAASHMNQYVPSYLVGNKSMPSLPPSSVRLGGEDEAISYATQFLCTWRNSVGAIPWLRKTLKIPLPKPPKPRKPAWSLFRHAFLRLPQVDEEVWQLEVCRLPLSHADGDAYRPPWALVLWNYTEDTILTFEAGDTQPTVGDTWNVLIEALLRPRFGEPHRPVEIQVRRKAFLKAWQEKLQQIGISCRIYDALDGLDRVMENLLPASTSVRRFLEGSESPVSFDLDELASLPQNMGESWQADVRRLPGWLEQAGELRRPWASLVTSRDEHTVLTQNLAMEPPPDEWIWKNVVDAVYRPLMGEPHRPGIVEVSSDTFQQVLYDRLNAIGVRCVVADDLEQIDEIFRQLGKFLSGGRAAPPLVEVPGVQLDQVRSFYEAAAGFYRAAPWRLVPGDTTLKIQCRKFSTHTWYGVVMGQSGLVLGLALYEDLNMLRQLFTGSDRDDEMSRQATGLSVMYGEAFEIPIADLESAERHAWPVAGPEAYPNPVYVNPGRSMRPPLAWELELLEGCLRAIPQFLQSGAKSATIEVSCSRTSLLFQLSQMEEM